MFRKEGFRRVNTWQERKLNMNGSEEREGRGEGREDAKDVRLSKDASEPGLTGETRFRTRREVVWSRGRRESEISGGKEPMSVNPHAQ